MLWFGRLYSRSSRSIISEYWGGLELRLLQISSSAMKGLYASLDQKMLLKFPSLDGSHLDKVNVLKNRPPIVVVALLSLGNNYCLHFVLSPWFWCCLIFRIYWLDFACIWFSIWKYIKKSVFSGTGWSGISIDYNLGTIGIHKMDFFPIVKFHVIDSYHNFILL